MPIDICVGNVLDTDADAILLTIDGARKGMGGNLALAFARRWPDAFMEIEDQIQYPVPLGRTILVRPKSDCPFEYVLVATTLHHLDILDEVAKLATIRCALLEMVRLAQRHKIRRIACTTMTGGWRLANRTALTCMLDTLRPLATDDHPTTVALHFLANTDATAALHLALLRNVAIRSFPLMEEPAMLRNLEAKYRIRDAVAVRLRIEQLTDETPEAVFQDDTFFNCSRGRLKLRMFSPLGGQLIFYRRDNGAVPALSTYSIVAVAAPNELRNQLTAAYGQMGRVVKRRLVFRVRNVRIHLDDVTDLGRFLEIEIPIDNEEACDVARRDFDFLLQKLDLRIEDAMGGSYVDLLRHQPA
jgi:predicted adenylyl cyclase CyaB